MQARLEASMKSYVYADHLPAFGSLLAANTGEFWVREFDNSDAMRDPTGRPRREMSWAVYAVSGAWVADVSLPARFVPYDVGKDYVAGVSVDEDDVEHVTILRLRR